MEKLYAVAYVSSAVRMLDDAELEALLMDARAFNLTQRVTGVLLHHDGTFFQYFEGPVDGIDAVYAKVRASTRHRGIVELMRQEVKNREFSNWSMGFSAVSTNLMLELERARWSKLARQLQTHPGHSDGLSLLLQFWRGALREKA